MRKGADFAQVRLPVVSDERRCKDRHPGLLHKMRPRDWFMAARSLSPQSSAGLFARDKPMPADADPGLFEIIRTTRSMRRLKSDPVPDELVREILEAGVCAPSGGNMQRWRFLS